MTRHPAPVSRLTPKAKVKGILRSYGTSVSNGAGTFYNVIELEDENGGKINVKKVFELSPIALTAHIGRPVELHWFNRRLFSRVKVLTAIDCRGDVTVGHLNFSTWAWGPLFIVLGACLTASVIFSFIGVPMIVYGLDAFWGALGAASQIGTMKAAQTAADPGRPAVRTM